MMAGEDRMSRLSIEDYNAAGNNGDVHEFWDDDNKPVKITTIEVEDSDSDSEDNSKSTCLGTERRRKEEEGWGRAGMRERWVDKAREMRSGCRVLVRTSHGTDSSGCICMDMTEVQACRDLGLELPGDWTVEIPSAGVSSSSSSESGGSTSSIASWTISSPGDDPEEVKARLKVWAQAVALASATQLATG